MSSRGFIPAGAVPVIGGVAAGVLVSTWLAPKVFASQSWYAQNQFAALGATAALGFAGYYVLKRYNRAAALAVLGGAVGFPVAGMALAAMAGAGTKGLGWAPSYFTPPAAGEGRQIDDGDRMRGMGADAYAYDRMN